MSVLLSRCAGWKAKLVLDLGKRQSDWEHPFVRLLHLLAHHPDFGVAEDDDEDLSEEDLTLMAK